MRTDQFALFRVMPTGDSGDTKSRRWAGMSFTDETKSQASPLAQPIGARRDADGETVKPQRAEDYRAKRMNQTRPIIRRIQPHHSKGD